MPQRRYDILAVDLDGTLLDPTGRVVQENVRAIARARAEGLHVTICTGRALVECRKIIEEVGLSDPVIVSGGALVADPLSGRTLERFTMDLGLVRRVVDYLASRDHPALLLKDPTPSGFDYLVVSPGGLDDLDAATRWWFEHQGIQARTVERLEHDLHPEHTVRVGAYSSNEPIGPLAMDLRERFGAEVMLQYFTGALMPPERVARGILSVHILELFNPMADKWQALSRLARRLDIPRERIAAIGDEHNDLSMVTHAGLGIAMGNACDAVKRAARAHAPSNREAGVAGAIQRILDGQW